MWQGLDLTWHPDLRTAVKAVVDWYKDDGGTLVLGGGYGCGKTTLAKIVLQAVGGPLPVLDWKEDGRVESIRNAVFYAEPDFLEDIRKSYRSGSEGNIVGQCQRAKLLIYDDLGAAYVKDESQRWYEDLIWRIFDPRKDAKNLITTNLTPPDLKVRIGGRAYSRLQEMLRTPEHYVNLFAVPDYRARQW